MPSKCRVRNVTPPLVRFWEMPLCGGFVGVWHRAGAVGYRQCMPQADSVLGKKDRIRSALFSSERSDDVFTPSFASCDADTRDFCLDSARSAADGAVSGLREPTLTSHALVGAKIQVSPDRVIESGTVVIRDGLIVAVGEKVAVPADAQVHNVSGKWIYPGFIDAYTELSSEASRAGSERGGAGYWNSNIVAPGPRSVAVRERYGRQSQISLAGDHCSAGEPVGRHHQGDQRAGDHGG